MVCPSLCVIVISYGSSRPLRVYSSATERHSGVMKLKIDWPNTSGRVKPVSRCSASLPSMMTPLRWNTMASSVASANLRMRSSLWRTAFSARQRSVMSVISTKAPTSRAVSRKCGMRLTSITRVSPFGSVCSRMYFTRSPCMHRSTWGSNACQAFSLMASRTVRPRMEATLCPL